LEDVVLVVVVESMGLTESVMGYREV